MMMVFNVGSVRLGVKIELYGSVVAPPSTHGAETLSMRMDERQKLGFIEMKCSQVTHIE